MLLFTSWTCRCRDLSKKPQAGFMGFPRVCATLHQKRVTKNKLPASVWFHVRCYQAWSSSSTSEPAFVLYPFPKTQPAWMVYGDSKAHKPPSRSGLVLRFVCKRSIISLMYSLVNGRGSTSMLHWNNAPGYTGLDFGYTNWIGVIFVEQFISNESFSFEGCVYNHIVLERTKHFNKLIGNGFTYRDKICVYWYWLEGRFGLLCSPSLPARFGSFTHLAR